MPKKEKDKEHRTVSSYEQNSDFPNTHWQVGLEDKSGEAVTDRQQAKALCEKLGVHLGEEDEELASYGVWHVDLTDEQAKSFEEEGEFCRNCNDGALYGEMP